jgi:CRP-like cAMP-binding protein
MARVAFGAGHLGLWLLIGMFIPISLWMFNGAGLRSIARKRTPQGSNRMEAGANRHSQVAGGALMARIASRIGHLGLWFLIGMFIPISLWMFIGAGFRSIARKRTPQEADGKEAGNEVLTWQVLRNADIFNTLPDRHLNRVAFMARRIHIVEGEVLGRAGGRNDDLFIIVSGEAQLCAHSTLGDITVRIAGSGQSWPLAGLVGTGALVTSAKAMTDMDLLAIPISRFERLCAEEPEIAAVVYRNIANVFVNRYRRTLEHFSSKAKTAVAGADFLANI